MTEQIINWSFSKLGDFESCKLKAKLKHIDRIPEPERPLPPNKSEHANDRGSRIHDSCEHYVRGTSDVLAPEAEKFFGQRLDLLRTLYTDGLVSLEGEWGMDRDWEVTGWNGQWIEITEDDAKLAGAKPRKVASVPQRGRDGEIVRVGKQLWLWEPSWLRLKLDALVFHDERTATIIDYKGLPLTTPLPTPQGWTTMGSVKVGDTLFDRVGNVCRVSGKSQVKRLPGYRITFDDTSVVECDEEHRWTLVSGDVVTAPALRVGDCIPTAEPLQLPAQELPLDPYVLGIWLADGKHTSGEICKPDAGIWEEIQRRGFALGDNYNRANTARCRTHTVMGLRTKLGELDLLGDKQIPMQYLRGSYEQRLDLLRGIMDGDGSANHTRKQAVINTTRLDFAEQVKELLLSLGQRPLLSPYTAHGFGKDVQAYAVSFHPRGLNPFLLARKANKVLPTWGIGESWRRQIKSIEAIDPQLTQCIMVDSPDHTFLCTANFVPTHNTGRKFGNEIKHAEQLQLYQLVTFLRYPLLETVFAELWYLDQDEVTSVRYLRNQGLRYKANFDRRGNALTTNLSWAPNANIHSCQWCPFGPWEGGTGHCQVGMKREKRR